MIEFSSALVFWHKQAQFIFQYIITFLFNLNYSIEYIGITVGFSGLSFYHHTKFNAEWTISHPIWRNLKFGLALLYTPILLPKHELHTYTNYSQTHIYMHINSHLHWWKILHLHIKNLHCFFCDTNFLINGNECKTNKDNEWIN